MRDLNEIERWILMFMTLALAGKLTDRDRLERMIQAAQEGRINHEPQV